MKFVCHDIKMSRASREEEIFETPSVADSSAGEQKLASYRESVIERPPTASREGISEARLNPDAAFGVFNGKVFGVPKQEVYSLADAIERRAEAPLQRYARLKGELDELKFDLDSMVESEANKSSTNSVWSVLQQEASKLSLAAGELENHQAFNLVRSNVSNSDSSLTGLVSSMNELNVTGAASAKATARSAGQDVESNRIISLERKVHHLETLLGSAANNNDVASSSRSPFPLADAVTRLEERVALLDTAELEALRAKCEAVRSEIESTIKSKSTLAAESKIAEATKQLSSLLGLVDRVDGVVQDLPALVLRLKTLEQVHLSAATFSARLGQMEGEVRGLTGELSSNKEVLAALKQSVLENVATMQQNIAAVNNKLA